MSETLSLSITSTLTSEAVKITTNGLAKATDRVIYRIASSDGSTAGSTYDTVHTFGANDVANAVAGHFNANNNTGISSAVRSPLESALF